MYMCNAWIFSLKFQIKFLRDEEDGRKRKERKTTLRFFSSNENVACYVDTSLSYYTPRFPRAFRFSVYPRANSHPAGRWLSRGADISRTRC